jgi:hypothetical protein
MKDENGPKDANDALRLGMDFRTIFRDCSRTLNDSNILTFTDMKDKVMRRILNFEENKGI